MRYRGVEYSILIGITREKWRVVVQLADRVIIERSVTGSREKAEEAARKMIVNLGTPQLEASSLPA